MCLGCWDPRFSCSVLGMWVRSVCKSGSLWQPTSSSWPQPQAPASASSLSPSLSPQPRPPASGSSLSLSVQPPASASASSLGSSLSLSFSLQPQPPAWLCSVLQLSSLSAYTVSKLDFLYPKSCDVTSRYLSDVVNSSVLLRPSFPFILTAMRSHQQAQTVIPIYSWGN